MFAPRLASQPGEIAACKETDGGSNSTGRNQGLPAPRVRNASLFQRGAYRAEHGVQVGADACDRRNDREGDSGCDQPILDGGGTRLIIPEFQKRTLHVMLPH